MRSKYDIRTLLCIIVGLFACSVSRGQKITLKGIVLNQTKESLVSASVHVQKKVSKQLLAFSITDQMGRFSLTFEAQDSLELVANYLGYTSFRKDWANDSLSENQYVSIELLAEAFTIDSFTVSASTAMLVKGDTIIFDASYFTDGTESVAEDVLKKLPGVQVAENGSIRVNGKLVETIMIDGDNIVGQQYEILSKNLSAKLIDKIEILDKFQNNPLYKGIETSDKIAINIKLEKKSNSLLFGNAEVALATKKFYEARLNTISLLKKIKIYTFSSANNIGEETGDDEILAPTGSPQVDQYIGDQENLTKSINLGVSQPDLKTQYYRFNQAGITNFHFLYSPINNLKTKISASLSKDLLSLFSQTKQVSQVLGVMSFDENHESQNKTFGNSVNFSAIWSKNASERLEYQSNLVYGTEQSMGNLLFNSFSLQERLNISHTNSDHILNYAKKAGENKLLILTARSKKQVMPQTYLINPSDPAINVWFNQVGVNEIQQQQNTELKYMAIEAKYLKKTSNVNQSYVLSISQLDQKMLSDLWINGSTADSGFNNNFYYKTFDFAFQSKQQYSIGKKLSLFARGEGHYNLNAIHEKNSESDLRWKAAFLPNINIGFNLNWSKKQKFMLSYNLMNSNPTLEQVQTNYSLQDYRTVARGITVYDWTKSATLLFNYTYGGWAEGLLVNASFIYNNLPRYISSKALFVNNYTQRESILLSDGKKMYIYNLSLDRFIKPLSCNLRLNITYSNLSLTNITNELERRIRTSNLAINTEMRSVWDGNFNVHSGINWRKNASISPIQVENSSMNSFIDMTYTFSKKFQINVKNDFQFINASKSEASTYLFTDGELSYKMVNRTSLLLSLRNVFNVDSYRVLSFDDVFSTETSFRLFPRYVMLRVSFGF